MIIMLNGSFGVGKSSVADALQRLLPNAIIYDPEAVGQLARWLTDGVRASAEDTDDFQDIAIWRALAVAAARELWNQYQRPLIVPMTIAHPEYFATITAGFQTICQPVHHFCLTAPLTTVQQRLLQRGDEAGGWSWVRAERYVPMFASERYRVHVPTEAHTPPEIAAHILRHVARL